MLKKLSNLLTRSLLSMLLTANAQRQEGHLLHENEVYKESNEVSKFLFGSLMPTVSKSEGQVTKPL
jgi:hypothetical protein